MKTINKILAFFGLASAGLLTLANVMSIEFLTELDLLAGFWGAWPHMTGIFLFIVAFIAATRIGEFVGPEKSAGYQAKAAFSALVLLIVVVTLRLVDIGDSSPVWLIESRWNIMLFFYILFFIFSGLAAPDLKKGQS